MNRMNLTLALLLAGILFIAGCGNDEPEEVAEDPPEAATTAPAEEPADSSGDVTAEEDAEAVEIVEESAADTGDEKADRILLAQANTAAATGEFKYSEGTHYTRLVPSQPTIGDADKIEVAEFFWYGCPHCYDLEPTINEWAADVPPTVRFVRVPAMWNEVLKTHAQLFFTKEVLAKNELLKDEAGLHNAVFEEYHRRSNRLLNEDAIQRLFVRFGVSEADFTKTWKSFEVSQKMRVAEDLARRYGLSSVPTLVVNGKYRTGAAEAGSYEKLIEVVDELVARENTR